MKILLFILWLSFLSLPFMGIKGGGYVFLGICAAYIIFILSKKSFTKIRFPEVSYNLKYFIAVLFLFMIFLPLAVKDYYIDIAILAGIYIILALGLNVVVGFTGLLNLGFAAFYAIGAYTYALLNTRLGLNFWSALPFSIMFSTAAGFFLAIPALRLRGDYLAIVTLGFGEIVRLIINNWDSLTMGPNGVSGIDSPSIMSLSFGKLAYYYYFVLIFVILTVFVTRRV